jgi:hypothetical protein
LAYEVTGVAEGNAIGMRERKDSQANHLSIYAGNSLTGFIELESFEIKGPAV